MNVAADRDAFRSLLVARIPRWYSPSAHLVVPGALGLAVLFGALALVRDLHPVQLLAVPIVYVASNAFEWRVHRDVLHRRLPLVALLYDRHTPEHHRIFVEDDMAMRSPREMRLVLIPAYGIVLIALLDVPVALALARVGLRNVGLLSLATSMGYVLSYEWLHLAYHLPPTSRIGRLALVARLRRHHAVHHAPERMRRWNFNVTVPLWDWVRGTLHRGDEP